MWVIKKNIFFKEKKKFILKTITHPCHFDNCTIITKTMVGCYKGFTLAELVFQTASRNRFEQTIKNKNKKMKMKSKILVLASLLVATVNGYKISGSSNDKGQRCVTVQECPHLVQLLENGSRVWPEKTWLEFILFFVCAQFGYIDVSFLNVIRFAYIQSSIQCQDSNPRLRGLKSPSWQLDHGCSPD